LKERFTSLFRSQPRAHWCALLEGSDACFAPVLGITEATQHPHHLARGSFSIAADGAVSARVAPRFSDLAAAASASPEPAKGGAG
jgi:alpha-methylacyl-CoA racemase